MAILPCGYDPHYYKGPAHHFYPALGPAGGTLRRAHLRVCERHATELRDYARQWGVVEDQAVDPDDPHNQCMGCGKPVSTPADVFYMTAYPRKDEREDYYGVLHPDCHGPGWLDKITRYAA